MAPGAGSAGAAFAVVGSVLGTAKPDQVPLPVRPEVPMNVTTVMLFDEQRDTFVAQAKQVRVRISEKCQPSGRQSGAGSMGVASPNCDDQLRLADDEEKSGLARIEAQRQAARIKTP